MLKERLKPSVIADSLGFSKWTINREIKRGMVYGPQNANWSVKNEYIYDNDKANQRKKAFNKGPTLKIMKKLYIIPTLSN